MFGWWCQLSTGCPKKTLKNDPKDLSLHCSDVFIDALYQAKGFYIFIIDFRHDESDKCVARIDESAADHFMCEMILRWMDTRMVHHVQCSTIFHCGV